MTRPARLIALAFLICVYLCLSVAKVQAANVRLWNIAPYSTTNSTHQLITVQISTNILSNGGVQAIGLPKRLYPAADGYVTNFYGLGFYAVKDAVTDLGLYVINVYDATTTQYDYTNLLTSGYNTYVVTTIVINTNLSAGLTPAQVGVMIQTSNNAAGLIYTNSFDALSAAATVNTKLDLNSVNQTNNTANHSTNDAYGAATTVNTKLDLNSVNLTNNVANHSTNDASGAATTVNTKLDLNSVNQTNNTANHSTNDAYGAAATVNTKLDLNSVNLTNNVANHSTNDASGAATTVNTKLDLNSVNLTNNIANHSTNDAAGAASTVNTKLDLNSVNLTNTIANHSTNDAFGAATAVAITASNAIVGTNTILLAAIAGVSSGGILTPGGKGTNTFLTNSPAIQVTNLMAVDTVGSSTFAPVLGTHVTVLGGTGNTAQGTSASVIGGANNAISGSARESLIGGGQGNTIIGIDGFSNDSEEAILGGLNNKIRSQSIGSAIAGGNGNVISNSVYSFAGGGSANFISNANYSVTLGNAAMAQHANTFVWNDNPTAFGTTGTKQFLVHAIGGIGFNTNVPGVGNVAINGNLIVNGTNALSAITTGDATLNTKIDLNGVNQTNNVANHSTNDPAGAAAIVNTKLDLDSVNGSNNVSTLDTKTLAMGLNLTNQIIHARAIAGRFTNTFVGLGWGTANFNTVFRLAGINAYTNLAGNAAITNGVGYNSGIIIYIWTNGFLTIPPIATNGGGAIGTINFYTNGLIAVGTNINAAAADGLTMLTVPNTSSNTFSALLNINQISVPAPITTNGASPILATVTATTFNGAGANITNATLYSASGASQLQFRNTNNILAGYLATVSGRPKWFFNDGGFGLTIADTNATTIGFFSAANLPASAPIGSLSVSNMYARLYTGNGAGLTNVTTTATNISYNALTNSAAVVTNDTRPIFFYGYLLQVSGQLVVSNGIIQYGDDGIQNVGIGAITQAGDGGILNNGSGAMQTPLLNVLNSALSEGLTISVADTGSGDRITFADFDTGADILFNPPVAFLGGINDNSAAPAVGLNSVLPSQRKLIASDGSTEMLNWSTAANGLVGNGKGLTGILPAGIATTGSTANQVLTSIGGNTIWTNVVLGAEIGTTTADNVAAGIVGEYTNKLVTSAAAISISTATAANVTNITLSAGDWEVSGHVSFALAGATTTAFSAGINTTSATIPTDGSEIYSAIVTTALTDTETLTIDRKRINVSTTTTIYLVGKSTFSLGTETIFGALTARRIR